MFAWLQNLPIWFQILFSIMVFIVFDFVLFFILKKGIKLNLKEKSMIIGGKTGSENEPVNPHKQCPYNKDIVILLNETNKILQNKFYITYVKQMRDQMGYAEVKTDQIRFLAQKVYLHKLEEKGIEDLIESVSYSSYRSILIQIQDIILKYLRDFFRQNHYANLSEQAFKNYVRTKIDFLKGETTDLFNTLYFYKEDISREELYELNKVAVSQAIPIMNDVFEMARLISIEVSLENKEHDKKLDVLIKDYI